MSEPKPPNILYIFTDQQSADAMSCAGNGDLSTPAVDRLAAEGARSPLAYCAFPLCTPARASMFSGLWPHQCEVTWNEMSMTPRAREEGIGNTLRAAGYECAYGGKWHVPWCSPMEDGHGFEVINSFDDATLAADVTAFLARPRTAPFFLVASFNNPHDICEYASGRPMPWGRVEPPLDIADCPPLPPNFAAPPYEPQPVARMRATDRTPDEWRRYRAVYFRLVEQVDREVGVILDALDRLGLADDTLVVFSSDHGDNQGAHRLQQKLTLNDESARVPLLARWPGRIPAGRVVERAPVSASLDLYPTFCAAAKVPLPSPRPGLDLLPVLTGDAEALPREAVVAMTAQGRGGMQGRMVRTVRHKYIAYEAGRNREQLSDMAIDPGELVNLAVCNTHRDILQAHRDHLRAWCGETGDRFGYSYTHPRVPCLIPGDVYAPDSGGLPESVAPTHPPLNTGKADA